MEELLSTINLTTGCFAKDEEARLLFLTQEKDDWIKEGGIVRIPFGGIGGKVEANETPLETLSREIAEEIRGDLKVEPPTENVILCDNLGNFFPSQLNLNKLINKRFPDEIKPQLIIANIYNDTNHPKFRPALIGVYRATVRRSIYPAGENSYLLHLNYPLLIHGYKQGCALNEIRQQRGKITANPDLKEQLPSLPFRFFPIGDARVLAILAIRSILF